MAIVRTRRLELIPLAPEAIEKLILGDRGGAAATLGVTFPDEFPPPGPPTTRRRSPSSAVSASSRSGRRSTRSTDSSWFSSAVRTPARQRLDNPRKRFRLRTLDLRRDRGGRVDERRRGRRSESIAMPYDRQDPWRDRLRKLRHTRRRLLLIDREQRRERQPKAGRHHRLARAGVLPTTHNQ